MQIDQNWTYRSKYVNKPFANAIACYLFVYLSLKIDLEAITSGDIFNFQNRVNGRRCPNNAKIIAFFRRLKVRYIVFTHPVYV